MPERMTLITSKPLMLDMALQTCIRDVTAVGHGKALQLNGRVIFESNIGETEPNRKNPKRAQKHFLPSSVLNGCLWLRRKKGLNCRFVALAISRDIRLLGPLAQHQGANLSYWYPSQQRMIFVD